MRSHWHIAYYYIFTFGEFLFDLLFPSHKSRSPQPPVASMTLSRVYWVGPFSCKTDYGVSHMPCLVPEIVPGALTLYFTLTRRWVISRTIGVSSTKMFSRGLPRRLDTSGASDIDASYSDLNSLPSYHTNVILPPSPHRSNSNQMSPTRRQMSAHTATPSSSSTSAVSAQGWGHHMPSDCDDTELFPLDSASASGSPTANASSIQEPHYSEAHLGSCIAHKH